MGREEISRGFKNEDEKERFMRDYRREKNEGEGKRRMGSRLKIERP